jgi:hypothetical protein
MVWNVGLGTSWLSVVDMAVLAPLRTTAQDTVTAAAAAAAASTRRAVVSRAGGTAASPECCRS